MARASTKRSKGNRQHGAVLVEGLIVASMLGLCLACAVFFHRLYSTKLAQVSEARKQAWQEALPGCTGGLSSALLNGVGVITAFTAAQAEGLLDVPDSVTDMGRGVGSPESRAVSTGAWMGGHVFTLESRRSVACNESAHHAEGDSNIGAIYRTVRDMFPF